MGFDEPTYLNESVVPFGFPSKPWLGMWFKPRATIRAIVDNDPRRYVIHLAALSGIVQALDRISGRSLGGSSSLAAILAIILFLGPVGGLVYLHIGGAILRWTGSLLGGQASPREVRAAMAWSAIPTIFGLVFWVPDLAFYGREMFVDVTPTIDSNPTWLCCSGFASIILSVWAFILLLKSLGEVHRFSAWRALAAVVLPFLAIYIPLFACLLSLGVATA